ncbi:signal peptidase I [Phormidium tenue FACHB-886]|nr:signal peptidase I [Phormidium tenue FACHB-886]
MGKPNGSSAPSQPKPENPWVEAAKTIGLSLLLAFGIRQFIAEARYIPSESMVPSLVIDDRLMVEKISYLLHSPERGDIVVFWPPENVAEACNSPSTHRDAFIKRIIGLPGDKVEVRNGEVLINDQPLQENYAVFIRPGDQVQVRDGAVFIDNQPLAAYEATETPPPGTWGPEVVASGSYFVMGDNRNNSCDSRIWGVVPSKDIIGRAAFRFWPLNRLGSLGN